MQTDNRSNTAAAEASSVGGSSIIVVIVFVCVCLVLWLLWQVVLVEQAQNAHRQTFCFDKLSFNENIKHLPYYQNVQSNDSIIICEYIHTEANTKRIYFRPNTLQSTIFSVQCKISDRKFCFSKIWFPSNNRHNFNRKKKKKSQKKISVKIVYTKLYDMKTIDFVQWNIKMLVNCIVCCQNWWHIPS